MMMLPEGARGDDEGQSIDNPSQPSQQPQKILLHDNALPIAKFAKRPPPSPSVSLSSSSSSFSDEDRKLAPLPTNAPRQQNNITGSIVSNIQRQTTTTPSITTLGDPTSLSGGPPATLPLSRPATLQPPPPRPHHHDSFSINTVVDLTVAPSPSTHCTDGDGLLVSNAVVVGVVEETEVGGSDNGLAHTTDTPYSMPEGGDNRMEPSLPDAAAPREQGNLEQRRQQQPPASTAMIGSSTSAVVSSRKDPDPLLRSVAAAIEKNVHSFSSSSSSCQQKRPERNHQTSDHQALCTAIINDDTDTAIQLLDSGAPCDEENSKGSTPLVIASRRGNTRIVEKLLQLGANPAGISSNGTTPVLQACHHGHGAVLGLLLKNGGWRLMDVANFNATTPLMRAAQEGHLEIVRDLLALGASVNRRNRVEMTALMLASQRGHHRICQLLIDYGADADARTRQDSTALLLACKRAHTQVARVLVTAGCELWVRDTRGRTAKDIALRRSRSSSINHNNKELQRLLDSEVQIHLMQLKSRRVRNYEIIRHWYLLHNNRALVAANSNGHHGQSMRLGIHEVQPLLANKPHDVMPYHFTVPSTQALLRTMALPAALVQHIASFLPLPNLWPKRLSMLTRTATIHPDAAVAAALDFMDEILEEGGFLEACDAARVVAPLRFESWKSWKIHARRGERLIPSGLATDGEERPVVALAPSEHPNDKNKPPSLTRMRRSVGFLPVLAHAAPVLRSVLSTEPYNMPPDLVEQLVRSSDLASLVRRMGSKGVHFDAAIAMDLVMLSSRLCTWFWNQKLSNL